MSEYEVAAKLKEAVKEQSDAIKADEGFWRHFILYRLFGQKIEHTSMWADSTGLRLHATVQPTCADCGVNTDSGILFSFHCLSLRE